jgi:DNA-binding NarL/FixJ family response regulator
MAKQQREIVAPVREGQMSLLLIDDHPVVGLGLSMALKGHPRFHLAGIETNPAKALRAIERLQPDALIVDLIFEGRAEMTLVRDCRKLLPRALLVVFSSMPARTYEREVLDMGADAFISKNIEMEVLLVTMVQLADGDRKPTTSPYRRRKSGDVVIDGVLLTAREADVADRLAVGYSIGRIATDLNISANTASVHRDNLRKKLQCQSMVELVARLARERKTVDGAA